MYKDSTSLKAYSIKLIEQALNMSNLGLSGKLGIAIFLLEYARWTTQDTFLVIGEQFVSDVLGKVSLKTLGSDHPDGIIDIGVGIAYLYDRDFIDGCPDETLDEIDRVIWHIIGFRALDLGATQFSATLIRLLFYLYLRIKGRNDLSIPLLTNQEHLIYAIDWLESLYDANKVSSDKIYTILCLLHGNQIYPTKTDALLTKEFERIIEQTDRPKFYSEIDLLDIPPLSALQLWLRLNN